MKTRGRPKGKTNDKRSFGPLGDLIRKPRIELGLGLADVAKAAQCSVQFISNIEHGRAPLPWNLVEPLARVLKISSEDLNLANFTIRSDFKGIALIGKKVKKPGILKNMASVLALTSKDQELQQLIQKYQAASAPSRKTFIKAALEMLSH